MLNATLVSRRPITDDLLIVRIRPDGGVPPFLPGQYVALGLPGSAPRAAGSLPEKEPSTPDKIIKRAYSIGSSPADSEAIEFYLAVVPDGVLTPRLKALAEGDRLFLAPKITGTFTLQGTPDSHNLILVATGTGLAPFISMVRTPSTWTAGRRITIVHGVRHSSDLAYDAELRALATKRSEFRYLPIVSREDPAWKGARGRVTTLFEGGPIALDAKVDHVFLCGNPAMVGDIEKMLQPKGYTEHTRKAPGNLHVERYW